MVISLTDTNKDSKLSFWALNIYSIIRTIKDVMSFEFKKNIIADLNKKEGRIVFGQKKYPSEVDEQLNKFLNDVSFASIFAFRQQQKIIDDSKKNRNFCFETVLSHYLITTRPGREYSYEILTTVRNMYDSSLLDEVLQIYLYVSGKENKLGNLVMRLHGDSMVLGGVPGLSWNKHHLCGYNRANSLDLSFVLFYRNKPKIVVLGEVEGNKGKELLKPKYWDERKPACALFGLGIDTLEGMSLAYREHVKCSEKVVPVIIFPDTKSKIFKHEKELVRMAGLEDMVGYTYNLSYTEFIRFIKEVVPNREYESANPQLNYIFSAISKDYWDMPFEVLLDTIEKNMIIEKDTQESLVAYDWCKGSKHYINIDPKSGDEVTFQKGSQIKTEDWSDPFDLVFKKKLIQ